MACSYRDLVDIVEEKKTVTKDGVEEEKTWKLWVSSSATGPVIGLTDETMLSFNLSSPKPVTYDELAESVNALASALIKLGFTSPTSPIDTRARVSIYADTSLRWQLMAQSFSRLGHVITTAYTTLGEEGLLRSLVEPDVELVFCGEDQLDMVAKVVGKANKVNWVVYDGEERSDKVCRLHPHFMSTMLICLGGGGQAATGRGGARREGALVHRAAVARQGKSRAARSHGSQADRG